MGGWRRWRRLGADDRAETLRASVLLPLCAAAVRLMRLPRILAMIAGRQPAGMDAPRQNLIDVSVRAVDRAAAYSPWPSACLTRSLTLMYLLRRRGVATDLKIGARLQNGALDAHAWIERDGVVLNDRAAVHNGYTELPKTQTAA